MPPATETEFVLGPSIDNVMEPFPATTPGAAPVAGRRGIELHTTPTSPGGNVHLRLSKANAPADVKPLNVYAFFVQPAETVPAVADRTTDWFFKSGAPSGSIHSGLMTEDTPFTVTVPGVKPSLKPYFVQTVLEFAKS